ncbi:hypothetical protein BDV29DRAFT_169714 [Aspergillus leporis]|jgi:hypothetical protein|uniref:Lipocalin-like domain-containing protein n=1 Tax=Aspergillus leporis TaxID=41062 RepID=A0A5N5X7D6_9EURO|nr:hypothetical protein BDV29DRAFT_169714 [Aspergillus leporis]
MFASSSLRENITGSWSLAKWVREPAAEDDNLDDYAFGEEVKGMIMYTQDRCLSAQMMRPGAPPVDFLRARGRTGVFGSLRDIRGGWYSSSETIH